MARQSFTGNAVQRVPLSSICNPDDFSTALNSALYQDMHLGVPTLHTRTCCTREMVIFPRTANDHPPLPWPAALQVTPFTFLKLSLCFSSLYFNSRFDCQHVIISVNSAVSLSRFYQSPNTLTYDFPLFHFRFPFLSAEDW